MWCNQIFSFVSKNEEGISIVQNTVVCDSYEEANRLARAIYGDEAIAVDTTLIPVGIGDIYKDNTFFRDGKEILRNPTEKEQITILQEENNQLVECIVDNDYRLSMMELGL